MFKRKGSALMKKMSIAKIFISIFTFALFFCGLFMNSSVFSNVVYAAEEGYSESGSCGTSAYWYYYDDSNTLLIEGSGAINTYNVGSAPWYTYKDSIKKIIVSDDITSMGEGNF